MLIAAFETLVNCQAFGIEYSASPSATRRMILTRSYVNVLVDAYVCSKTSLRVVLNLMLCIGDSLLVLFLCLALVVPPVSPTSAKGNRLLCVTINLFHNV